MDELDEDRVQRRTFVEYLGPATGHLVKNVFTRIGPRDCVVVDLPNIGIVSCIPTGVSV